MTLRQEHAWTIVVSVLLCVLTSACGGGGNSGGGYSPPPPPNPSFTISLSPTTLTLTQGAAGQPLQVSISAQNGFTGTVSVIISTLPTGVTATPSSLSVTPNTPGSFTLSASSTAELLQESVTVTGASGALSASASLGLGVTGPAPPDPFHVVGGSTVHGFFDESRQLLFATNIGLNELDVISSANPSTIQTRVPVPQPIGIDQMGDGKTLVIGTAAQELVTVDEDTFVVTQYPFSEAGSGGFTLFFPTVVALANGNVIVIGQEQGVDSNNIVDGGQYLYIWNSSANTFTQLEPTSSNVVWETDSLARSADHKWAVFAGDQFYLYSSDSNSLNSVPLTTVNPPENEYGVRGYAINSDGSEIAVASASQVTFLNNSLTVLGTASIPGAFQLSRTEVQFSADDTKLYLQYPFALQVQVIDATTYSALGYLLATVMPADDNLSSMLATDAEGHGYFGVDGGVRILDLTQPLLPNGPNGMQGPPCPTVTASLPLNVSQQLQLGGDYSGISIFVGGQAAPLLNEGGTINVPASSAVGPVDVLCVGSTGDSIVYADAVSYGVEPIAFSANLLPPSGNPAGYLFGFGFSGQPFEVPSVTIGGVSATNVTDLQDLEPGVLQGVALQVPDGSSGQSPSITATSSDGTGTLSAAATYYTSPTIVPATGLLQLLYDSHRDLVYALKATEVDVLNPTTLQWETPLSFPSTASGTYHVMALTPDGSKLVVSGTATAERPQVIVIDPTNGSPAYALTDSASNGLDLSGSIAITASNDVIFAGLSAIELDLASSTFTPLNVNTGALLRTSPDGTHIFGADLNVTSGAVYSINPTTFAVETEGFGQLFWADLAVSPGGTQFAAIDIAPDASGDAVGFFNTNLQYLNANEYPAFSPPDTSGAIGSAFSPEGKVLVVPLGDSIEFWDTSSGTLRARLMTPEALQVIVYPEAIGEPPTIALDTAGQTIYAISASGVTVFALAQPLDQMPVMQWPNARAGKLTGAALRGSMRQRVAAMNRKVQKLPRR